MTGQSSASPFLFQNKKPTFTSKSRSFDVSSPVTDGIAIINVEGDTSFRLISANEPFLNMVNKDDEREPIGSHVDTIIWGEQASDNKLQNHLEQALKDKKPLAFIWQLKIEEQDKTILCKIIPLLTKEGEIGQITVNISDFEESQNLKVEVDRYNYFDQLTGLPNRFKLFETLEQKFRTAKSESSEFSNPHGIEAAILFININKLQRINESYGYEYGDRILKAVADHIGHSLHENAFLARFTNDNFVVFMSENHFDNVKREANLLAQSIHHNFATNEIMPNCDISLSVSIGIATGSTSNETADQLMQNAHLAMRRNDQSMGFA